MITIRNGFPIQLWTPGVIVWPVAVPLAEVRASLDNPPERTRPRGRPRRGAMTLSGLHLKFLQYCEVERRLALQTIVAYRSDFVQFLEFLREGGRWGLVSQDTLGAFSAATIRDYQYYMAAHGWSTATIRRRLVELNSFGSWLVKRGFLPANPMAEVEVPRRPRRLPRALVWADVERAIAGERGVRDRAVLTVLAYAGLRRGEVVSLDVRDFSREAATLRVRGKGSKERVVGLPRPAWEALEAYLGTRPQVGPETPLFITAYGQRITHKVVTRAVRRAGERLGFRIHPHLFRHTYATELLERGADIRVIRDLLGHESVATTEIYTHVSAARQRQVVQLLEGRASGEAVMSPRITNPGSALRN